MVVTERSELKKKTIGSDTWYYLGLIGEIGYAIAIPIAGGTLVGVWIDRTWSLYPKATLLLLVIGCIVSGIGMTRTISEIIRKKK